MNGQSLAYYIKGFSLKDTFLYSMVILHLIFVLDLNIRLKAQFRIKTIDNALSMIQTEQFIR